MNAISTWLRAVVTFFSLNRQEAPAIDSSPYGGLYIAPPLQCVHGETNEQYNQRSLREANRRVLARNYCDNTDWMPERTNLVPLNRRERRNMRFGGELVLTAPDSYDKPAVPYYIAQQSNRERAKQLQGIGGTHTRRR